MHPWLASLLGALVPEPERGALVRRFGGDPPRASLLIGAVEFVAGLNFLYESGMAHFRAAGEAMAIEFLRQAERATPSTEQAMGLTLGGAVVWLAWLLRPTTWLLISIPLVGLLRSSAYLTASEIFPLEVRAFAIALFFMLGTATGGIVAPWLFGALIETGEAARIGWGYYLGAALMLGGAAAAWLIGVDAERKPLESVAKPLSSAH